ncbi:MAG: glycine zipper 2TM domain-containing protein [Novosphingobium sp.]
MSTLFKKAVLVLALPGLLATAAPAFADGGHRRDGWHGHDRYGSRYDERRGYRSRDYYARSHDRGYYRQRAYAGPTWRGRDGRYYCRRDDGTTGLLVGAAVGGVLGHEVAGRGGDRTLGVILGAAGGALLGRAVDRSDARCR